MLHPSLTVYDYDNFDFYDDHDGVDHDHDGDGVKGDHDDNDNDLTRIKCCSSGVSKARALMIMRTMTTKMKKMKMMKQRLSLADTIYPCELPYWRRHYTDPSHCLPPPHQNIDAVATWDGWMDGLIRHLRAREGVEYLTVLITLL